MGGARRVTEGIERGAALTFTMNGVAVQGYEGETIATALLAAGRAALRVTLTGAPRGIYCGRGICHDCLVTVDGEPNVRACVTVVRSRMCVETQTGLGTWGVTG
jgi:aerobic-type carbon monoxide dehydrogenase small subunit (CoxS/CutS family)